MTLRKVYETVRKVIIYEIVCNITSQRYIGSTTYSLAERIRKHKIGLDCNSKIIINRGDYTKTELESFYTKFELAQLLKEQYWMDNTENINIQRAYTSKKLKRNIDNIKTKIKYSKMISINCPCGGKYKTHNICRHFKSKIHMRYIEALNR
jgi:hypothetical protein